MSRLCVQVGIRLRATIVSTIYRKALRVAASASNGADGSSTGQIMNLLAVDLQRLQDMLQFLWLVWYAPLNLVIAMALLYMQVTIYLYKPYKWIMIIKSEFELNVFLICVCLQIKWVAFAALGIMFLALIFNVFVAAFFPILQARF